MILPFAESPRQPSLSPFARVEDFLSASQNNDPNLYPGQRPETSYVTDGTEVFAVNVTIEDDQLSFRVPTETGEVDVDDYLRSKNVPTMEERIPVLAFGANMAPGSLAKKFRKDVMPADGDQAEHVDARPDLSIVPTIYGTLPGYDVVWSGGPGVNGNLAAILYRGAETADTRVQVGLNFLTREQLLMMNATELSYNLSTLEVEVAGKQVRALYYAGADSIYLRDGKPIAVQGIPAQERNLSTDTTRHLLDDLLENSELRGRLAQNYPELANITTSSEYHDFVRSLKSQAGSQPRLALKKFVQAALLERGKAKIVEDTSAQQRLVSWANPSTIAAYGQQKRGIQYNAVYRLPSQELPKEAWQNAAARDKVLRGVGVHLTRTALPELVVIEDQKKQ
ncbi:MAG: hypothetical protein WC498_04425 [Candidatus Saccharimonadales bacterium]